LAGHSDRRHRHDRDAPPLLEEEEVEVPDGVYDRSGVLDGVPEVAFDARTAAPALAAGPHPDGDQARCTDLQSAARNARHAERAIPRVYRSDRMPGGGAGSGHPADLVLHRRDAVLYVLAADVPGVRIRDAALDGVCVACGGDGAPLSEGQ